MGSFQCELYCQMSKLNGIKDYRTWRIALGKCMFLLLYMKDFVTIQEYISLFIKEDSRYQYVWQEIEELLDTVKKSLNARKGKDVIGWVVYHMAMKRICLICRV